MPKQIQFEGKTHVFPDDFTDQDIAAALTPPKTVSGFASNVLKSAGNFASDLAHAVTHPGETAKGMLDIAAGTVSAMTPGSAVPEVNDAFAQQRKTAGAAWDQIKQRYGSPQAAYDTFYNDPVGFLSDASVALGGGTLALKGAKAAAGVVGATRTADALGKAAKVTGTVAPAIDPMNAAMRTGAVAVRGGAKAMGAQERAVKMYEGALKPHKGEYSLEEAREMAKTGLAFGLPVSEAGLTKLWSLLEDWSTKADGLVQDAAARGVKVDAQAVADRIDQIKPRFDSLTPRSNQQILEGTKREFLEDVGGARPGIPAVPPQPSGLLGPNGQPVMTAGTPAVPPVPPRQIPVDELQTRKVNTYRELKKSYGEMKGAEIESRKALARGAAEELKNAIPELSYLWANEKRAFDIAPALETAVKRNPSMLGDLKTGLTALFAHQTTGSVQGAAIAAAMHAMLKNPYVRGQLARAINEAQQMNPGKFGRPSVATSLARADEYIAALQPAMAQ